MAWLWEMLCDGFDALIEAVGSAVTHGIELFWEWIVLPLLAWFGELGASVVAWIAEKIPYVVEELAAIAARFGLDWSADGIMDSLDTLWGVVETASWVLPVGACVSIWMTGFAAAMSIRIVRILVGWLPGVEG